MDKLQFLMFGINYNLPNFNNTSINKKHLKNVGHIRHCEPPHAACRYCRVARRLRIDVHNNDDDDNDNA